MTSVLQKVNQQRNYEFSQESVNMKWLLCVIKYAYHHFHYRGNVTDIYKELQVCVLEKRMKT